MRMTDAEQEIVDIPPLTPGETSLLDQHSVLNVLNVLLGELTLLGLTLAGDPELLRPALRRCDHYEAALTDPAASLRQAEELDAMTAAIDATIKAELDRRPGSRDIPAVVESLGNLRSVYQILAVRAQEILARARAPAAWVDMPIQELRADFQAVFAAMERNSHGRYRIIYNLALQQAHDYYVDVVIESQDGRTVALPLVFKDVMRDLMANARKYTPIGGTISAGLHETADCLKFTIQDSGRGIPPDEVQTVFHYGKRGSNVGEVRTMGGGFGLTKAFLVTKQLGGRFWIRSTLGAGTRLRMEIPRPGRGG